VQTNKKRFRPDVSVEETQYAATPLTSGVTSVAVGYWE